MWPFNTARRKSYKKVKAEFEAAGFIIETRRSAIWRWLRNKWDRFGSI